MLDIEKIQTIYQGKTLDGRTMGSLKRKGYLEKDGSLTLRGMHLIGVYKHVPQIPLADIEKYVGKVIVINENIYSGCECCGSHYTETYMISAEKLAKEYNEYVTYQNKRLYDMWGETTDYEYGRGFAMKGIKGILINAVKRDDYGAPCFDRRYVQGILNSAMEQLVSGKDKGYASSSYKYSISDTQSEVADLLIVTGEKIFTMEVEINR